MTSLYNQIVDRGETYLYISESDDELLPTGAYWIDLSGDVTVRDNDNNEYTPPDVFVFNLSETLEEIIEANDERLFILLNYCGLEPFLERAVEFMGEAA